MNLCTPCLVRIGIATQSAAAYRGRPPSLVCPMRFARLLTSHLVRASRTAMWLLLVIGLTMHFTVRDGIDAIAFVFYILSMPVLLCLALLLGFGPQSGACSRRPAMIVALLVVVTWSTRSWRWHGVPPTAQRQLNEVRVMFWNLSRPTKPFDDFVNLVKEFQPDVIGCTEPADKGQRPDMAMWQQALPQYRAGPGYQEILWFTRTTPRHEKMGMLDSIGSFAHMEMDLAGQVVPVVIADVWASPWIPRTRQLHEAVAQVAGRSNALLLGDFNTPGESVHFDGYRRDLTDAFEAGGRGLRETWFYGLPVLSIDHVWAGRDWQVLNARKVWSLDSDHAALLVRLVPRTALTTGQSIHPGRGE